MQIKVTGRHIDITPAIRDYAVEKVSKLPRYFDLIQEIRVVADKRDRTHEIEIIVEAEHTDPFVSKTEGDNLYACIDDAVNKLERQLTDHKNKLRNRKHNTG